MKTTKDQAFSARMPRNMPSSGNTPSRHEPLSRRNLLSRRNILRGAGVCVALPWLESLLPNARAQQPAYPKRFLPIFFPNGAATQWWDFGGVPGSGAAWQLSPLLEPFAALKSKLIVFDGLNNYSWIPYGSPVIYPQNSRFTGAFLTCVNVGNGGVDQSISADQVIAQDTAGALFPSLQVGLSTMDSSCDGLECSFSRSISWLGPGQPLVREVDPQAVFDRLFGTPSYPTPSDQAEVQRRRALDLSVLDYTLDSAQKIQPRLGVSDRHRVDEFLTSVRELENRVLQLPPPVGCSIPSRPTFSAHVGLANGDEGYSRETHATIMNDLIVMALQCDATRIISYMLDDARSMFVYDHVPLMDFGGPSSAITTVGPFYGVHFSGNSSNAYASINYWLNAKVADLCQKLASIPEGDGSLLDHAVVFYASNFDGPAQKGVRIPALLLGGGAGVFKMDQLLKSAVGPGDPQFRDLYYTIMNSYFELPMPGFGADFENKPARVLSDILV